MTHEQVPTHGPQTHLRDALLDVPVEAAAREIPQPVGADALLAAAAERDHVRFAQPLAGVFVERARDLRADGGGHLAVGIEEPGEDGAGVSVEERIVDVEHRGGALERLHHFPRSSWRP